MIAIRFHSTDKLDYQKQLGFDGDEPEIVIETITNKRVRFDCAETPNDDDYTEIIYMQCENSETDPKAVFEFLTGCLHPHSNLLIELFACTNQLDSFQLLYSNATDDLHYGYGWEINR
jgi:hypothetical protein